MHNATFLAYLLSAVHIGVFVALSVRIISRNLNPSTSLAWLFLVAVFPIFGMIVYILVGERPLGRKRRAHALQLRGPFLNWRESLPADMLGDASKLHEDQRQLVALASSATFMPLLRNERIDVFEGAKDTIASIIKDLDAARDSCDMAFYIWNEGGLADDVAQALERAAKRGVRCRLLLDAVGSRPFLKTDWVSRLRASGIDLKVALPVGAIRALFVRADLRLHRKIVVIDNRLAYTGSMNMVDPQFFKKGAGVGEWVDAMLRFTGPPVAALKTIFLVNWTAETGESPAPENATNIVRQTLPDAPGLTCVITPSGPDLAESDIRKLLLCAIYESRSEIVITTPYFIPDEAMTIALESAACRGVRVTVIVPARVDSLLVRYASRSFFDRLLAVGVKITQFHDGLLHTKSLTSDGKTVFFGTVNLDIRSMQLNFEVTAIVFDIEVTQSIRRLQARYEARSTPIDLNQWRQRPVLTRFLESTARLTSPLL